jgi:hypothetical protein
MYRVGTANIYSQSHLVTDMSTVLRYNLQREEDGIERERGDCLVFKLAAVALPIYANPYNHNSPMQEHS